jgi:pimeloyl-ACP methyl ester carboxylesterase
MGALKATNAVLEQRYPPPGRMVSIGTHRLHLYCFGSGSPTVVLEPGLGSDWVSWEHVATTLAAEQQVCVYDRAGYGWSDPGPMPRTANRIAGELHQLLTRAGIPPPYVLVGHSFGTHIARAYASRFGSSLKGIVMAEPADEKEREGISAPRRREAGSGLSLPAFGWTRIRRMYAGESRLSPDMKAAPVAFRNRYIYWSPAKQLEAEKSELGNLLQSDAEVRAAPFPPDVPLIVITASRGADPSIRIRMQQRLAQLSPLGRQVVSDSKGHFVYIERPKLVLDATREISFYR